MRKILSVLSLLLLLFFINCPQEQKNEPTAEEKAGAQKSIKAINMAMQQSVSAGISDSNPSPGITNPMYSTFTYPISETLDASKWGGSGTVTVTGSGTYDDVTQKYSMTMTVTFTNYTYMGITINGSCTMNCTATESPFTFNMSYNGSFKVTGEYNMSISIKETFKMTETEISYTATITVDEKEWTESGTVALQ